jgi:hypothetical protein
VEIQAARRWGALLRRPPIGVFWPIAGVLVALYAAHQGLGLGGPGADGLFNDWVNDGLMWGAAFGCVGAALRGRRSRAVWLLVALALASWAIGDTILSIRFGAGATPPATSISDVFWLAWYPLVVAALVLLVRERVPGFELHRWIDGLAVMLLVATPWVALFLQPVAEHTNASGLAIVLDFAYPLADAILVGAVLGVFVLMDWRPGRMWLALGVALTAMGIADAIYSVQALGHSHDRGVYDAAWAGAAILVAYAAWQPNPGRLEPREVIGWRAIALAMAAQALAVSIQIYAIFEEVPQSERILTVLVLIIATIQIVSTRPRPQSGPGVEPASPGPELGSPAAEPRSAAAKPGSPASVTVREPRGDVKPNSATPTANQPTGHAASDGDPLEAQTATSPGGAVPGG